MVSTSGNPAPLQGRKEWKMLQLNLFTPSEPEWKDITIEWLFEFLNNRYREMKFYIDRNSSYDGTPYIRQNLHEKIECSFHIGEFDIDVNWVKNRNYIGVSYGKCFGNYGQTSYPIDTMDEFKEYLPRVIEESKKNITLYKEYIKNRKDEDVND